MIREVCVQDYEKIYELGSALQEDFKTLWNLEELLQHDYFKLIVFVLDGEVAGFLMYTVIDTMVDVMNLVVDKKYRRKHIATRLLDYLFTSSKPEDKFYLEVRVDNQAALSLYEKFGFQRIHTRKKYYGDTDAFVMERVNENE